MPGHVFILHADLTRQACDAWLMPCGISGRPKLHWLSEHEIDSRRPWPALPQGWGYEGVRCLKLHTTRRYDERGIPQPIPWLVNVGGGPESTPQWYVEGVRQFMAAACADEDVRTPLHQRERPLIALPIVGTGFGGMRQRGGEMVRVLLPELYEAAATYDVDIALVALAHADFTAAQRERRSYHQQGHARWPELDPELRARADELAMRASDGALVLFIGSGVGVGAGLATWGEFLRQLGQLAPEGLSLDWEQLGAWSYADQARILERSFGSREAVCEAISQLLRRRHYSLTHSLLAALPVQEFVTTNYDTLLEDASRAIGIPTFALPYERVRNQERWVLKLHGCINHPEDIVLTREDYLRYATQRTALAGIVQSLLLTKHLLFVGFSLDDDNFHRMADDVRRIARRPSLYGAPVEPFGTSLVLRSRPFMAQLWAGEVELVTFDQPPEKTPIAKAARKMEIFLDYLLAHVEHTAYLLDARFSELLGPDEQEMRRALLAVVDASTPGMRRTPAWRSLSRLLISLGWSGALPAHSSQDLVDGKADNEDDIHEEE